MNRWLDKEIDHLSFVALDIETTGLRFAENHRIVEIGLVRYGSYGRVGQLSILINPERDIPDDAVQIHGITERDVADAPVFEAVIPLVRSFVMDLPIVVYNENFDMGFINYQMRAAGHEPLTNPVIDALEIARRLNILRAVKGYRLGNVARALRVEYRRRRSHRALYDAYVTAEVFRAMVPDLKQRPIHTLRDLLIWLGRESHHLSDILRAVNRAIFDNGYLRIVYITMHHERTERIIRPVAIEDRNQEHFIRAYCFTSKDERVFRVRQIREWTYLPTLPSELDPEA